MEFIDLLISAGLWATVLRIATPLIFGTLGELICERAGVLNLGIEGIMVIGAFAGWMTVYAGLGLWTGVGLPGVVVPGAQILVFDDAEILDDAQVRERGHARVLVAAAVALGTPPRHHQREDPTRNPHLIGYAARDPPSSRRWAR